MTSIDKMRPSTGRMYAEDDTYINFADFIRSQPISIARGLKPGAIPFSGFGERTTAGAETNFPVWPDGPFRLPPPAGLQMSIVSTSPNDSAAGTGVQQVEIHYNDGLNNQAAEVVTLNGTTPVLTTATDMRFIECMHISRFGTTAAAAGTITASNAGIIYSIIPINEVRCTSAFRMVPAGKNLYVSSISASSISGTSAARAVVRVVASELDNHQYTYPLILIPFGSIGLQDSSSSITFEFPARFSAGTVVGAVHTTDKACTTGVTWFGWLEDAE